MKQQTHKIPVYQAYSRHALCIAYLYDALSQGKHLNTWYILGCGL